MQNTDNDDKQLIFEYLNGNEESLKTLIRRYLSPIYNFTYRMCSNTENAEDITAEVFVKVWKNLKKYNPEQNFRVWLFRIARNTAYDWLRKEKSVVFSSLETKEENFIENTVSDENPLPDEFAMMEEDKKLLAEKVLQLSPIYQTILTMRYTEGFSFKEISEILQKSIDTVKSQHRRALIQLRNKFTN